MTTTIIPTWLNIESEITSSDQPVSYKSLKDKDKACAFILLSMKCLIQANLGVDDTRLMELVSNSIAETGWGRFWRSWNFGGWKINKSDVDKFKLAHGGAGCPPWYRAAGHVASGDQPVVYYRGFPSSQQYYLEWIERFIPKVSTDKHRYHKTGIAFWASDKWFLQLCLAGYKGAVTQAEPGPSVIAHEQIVARAKKIFCQFVLGVDPDADWGNGSKTACKNFQKAIGLPETGLIDLATYHALVNKWIAEGMKQNFIL